MAELQENTPYDDVFKTQKVECPRLLIPVINEAFHKKYDKNVEIIKLEDEIEYQIPLIKLKDYTLDMIFEKHLFILLPFWIFTYEDRLKEYEENENQKITSIICTKFHFH